jgi:hypothetical protein
VFKIKPKELINDIHKKHILGRMVVGIDVIEFQKRGLPHAHILILFTKDVATLALARDQGKGVARLRAYK